jgi:hypothetical protein
MSEDILKELGFLFDWNPPALLLAVGHDKFIRPEDEYVRQASFYDMHLAPNLICKRVIHIKNLHKKVCQVVDRKIQEAYDRGVVFQPSSAIGFVDKANREQKVDEKGNPVKSRRAVGSYYSIVTSECCLPIASGLALHPKTWRRVITWSDEPQCNALGSCNGSLQMIDLDRIKQRLGPEFIDQEMLDRLKKIATQYADLATWEITSLSIEDTNAMLGVLTTATASGQGEFCWSSCSRSPYMPEYHDIPKALRSTQTRDTLETLRLAEAPWVDMESSTNEMNFSESPEGALDVSLRRGGSSFEAVRDDISTKTRFPSETPTSSETGSEPEHSVSSKDRYSAGAEEMKPWTPPEAGSTSSQKLIQKVSEQLVFHAVLFLTCLAG